MLVLLVNFIKYKIHIWVFTFMLVLKEIKITIKLNYSYNCIKKYIIIHIWKVVIIQNRLKIISVWYKYKSIYSYKYNNKYTTIHYLIGVIIQ